MQQTGNVLKAPPPSLPTELIETLIDSPNARIERIVSLGHASPTGFWYDQPQYEWVMVVQGAAKLHFEDQEELLDLKPGDWINIASHRRHRVEWTTPDEPTIWLAVHYDA